MGIYKRSVEMTKSIQQSEKLSSLDQYFTDYDLSMPMSLYLYDYTQNQDKTIEINNLISWEPKTDQWWATVFNPAYKNKTKTDVENMLVLGTIDFSTTADDRAMYEKFKSDVVNGSAVPQINIDNGNAKAREQLIFDDDNHMVWLMWWGE